MAKVVVGMTMSLDGFVNDRQGSVARLYPDLAALQKTEMLREAIANTGSVVMGRRAYDMANGDFTGYEFQVPIFVVTHRPPAKAASPEAWPMSDRTWLQSVPVPAPRWRPVRPSTSTK